MATTQKRPRLAPHIAELVDAHRGSTPFEQFVNDTLFVALGPLFVAEPDPERPRRYRVVSTDDTGGSVYATGLTKHDAGVYASLLEHLAQAENHVETINEEHREAFEVLDAEEALGTVFAELEAISKRLYDLAGHTLGEAIVIPIR